MHYIGLKSRGLVSQTKIIKNVVQNELVNNVLALGTSDNNGDDIQGEKKSSYGWKTVYEPHKLLILFSIAKHCCCYWPTLDVISGNLPHQGCEKSVTSGVNVSKVTKSSTGQRCYFAGICHKHFYIVWHGEKLRYSVLLPEVKIYSHVWCLFVAFRL